MIEPDYWAEIEAAWEDRVERPAPRRLGPLRGGTLAAMMLGVREALEPEQDRDAVIEFDRLPTARPQRVQVWLDPVPRRSLALIRDLPG